MLFRSSAEAATDSSELFAVAADGGGAEKLPLRWAGRIAIDSKTGMWAFNRSSWENATWKRYRGGTAPKIWVGHPDKTDFKQVTRFDGPDAFPMSRDGRVYFLSDQGGTANIWSMKPGGSDRKQHTRFKDWDARWPSNEPNGRIVVVLGGDLHLLDPAGDKVQKLDVDLPSERTLTRGRYPEVGRALSWASLSPDGDRLAIVSRGEIFSVIIASSIAAHMMTDGRSHWFAGALLLSLYLILAVGFLVSSWLSRKFHRFYSVLCRPPAVSEVLPDEPLHHTCQ